MLDCYIINLDRASDRWDDVCEKFSSMGLNVIRITAIDGKTLQFPHPDFAEWRYFLYHGRIKVPSKVACYFSHIKALRTFLETDKDHVMICEDDVHPQQELMDVVNEAMQYSHVWDLLRLNGIKPTRGVNFATLSHGYQLCCDLKTASGNGGKIVNRIQPASRGFDASDFGDFPKHVFRVGVGGEVKRLLLRAGMGGIAVCRCLGWLGVAKHALRDVAPHVA
jgi:glycosyl transferase family 25